MFPGTSPFEAKEASVFADWARNLTAEGTPVVGLLDFHSYSQQSMYHPILSPFFRGVF